MLVFILIFAHSYVYLVYIIGNLYIGDSMNIIIYASILTFKIIENALATLRIIVIANGKKKLGAFLQFLIALIWILVTGTVITNVKEDPLKVFFFALGSLLGSYIGSVLEEKIAMGNNVFMVVVNNSIAEKIENSIKNKENVYSLKLTSSNKTLLLISLPRKIRSKIIKIIKEYDSGAVILSEKAKVFNHV